MFEKSTLVIVGAGASNEASLPTGADLKNRIARMLDIKFDGGEQKSGDYIITNALRIAAQTEQPTSQDINQYLRQAWHIRDALPQAISIDNFLDAHQGNARLERCGKLAIVRAILEGERNSSLYVHPQSRRKNPDFSAIAETWYGSFFQLLTENCRAEQLEERLSMVTLVVFNYDRCVEQFLYCALQNYYAISPERASRLLAGLKIFHPYGSVGALPWQGRRNFIDFGSEPTANQLFDFSTSIKTFTEGTDPEFSEVQELRQKFVASSIILFLGFAYHRQNLSLLTSNSGQHADPSAVYYFGSAKGLSKSDCHVIVDQLTMLAGSHHENITLRNDLTCAPFFSEYWRSLSLA